MSVETTAVDAEMDVKSIPRQQSRLIDAPGWWLGYGPTFGFRLKMVTFSQPLDLFAQIISKGEMFRLERPSSSPIPGMMIRVEKCSQSLH